MLRSRSREQFTRLFAPGEVRAPHNQKEKKSTKAGFAHVPCDVRSGARAWGPSAGAVSRGAGLALTTRLPWTLSEHVSEPRKGRNTAHFFSLNRIFCT